MLSPVSCLISSLTAEQAIKDNLTLSSSLSRGSRGAVNKANKHEFLDAHEVVWSFKAAHIWSGFFWNRVSTVVWHLHMKWFELWEACKTVLSIKLGNNEACVIMFYYSNKSMCCPDRDLIFNSLQGEPVNKQHLHYRGFEIFTEMIKKFRSENYLVFLIYKYFILLLNNAKMTIFNYILVYIE